jgi:Raf kinase inhibitor-like YbhB/YbcL family protein
MQGKQRLLKVLVIPMIVTDRAAGIDRQDGIIIRMCDMNKVGFLLLFVLLGLIPRALAADVVAKTTFVLRSPEVVDGGMLPKEFTGDGASATLPLEWSGAPEGTKSYALIMYHIDREGKTKWYWILYNIPPGTTSLPKNVNDVGIMGNNSINGRVEYAPPHSKGPGAKTYVYTIYALSAPVKPKVAPVEVGREVLLAAMQDYILATAELKVVYTRSERITAQGGSNNVGSIEQ